MNCVFRLYAGFCCLLKECRCDRPTPQNPNKEFNPFFYVL